MNSPFSDKAMQLRFRETEMTLKDETFTVTVIYYYCTETQEEFSTNEVDDLTLYQVYWQYAEKHNLPIEAVMPHRSTTNMNNKLHIVLAKHGVTKIQVNHFDDMYRIDSVRADIIAYTKDGPISDDDNCFTDIEGEFAYSLKEAIQVYAVRGEDIVAVLPDHIEAVNKDGLDLRSKQGLEYCFEVEPDSSS